jgi:DNA topoisomerase IB
MIIEFQNVELDLSDTLIEYNGSIRGDISTIDHLVRAAAWLGYQIDVFALWDGIDRATDAIRELGGAVEKAIEALDLQKLYISRRYI